MNTAEKADYIIQLCLKETSINPFIIFRHIVERDFVSMHGPEHHVIDGACLLTAYYNAGGSINLAEALEKIKEEGLRMPGAICGMWGVCGAVLSVGCALAIMEGTGPLSRDGTWGRHMVYTSQALREIGETIGPRCCKRDGMIALAVGIRYINEQTAVRLEDSGAVCLYSDQNPQCIGKQCPYNQIEVLG